MRDFLQENREQRLVIGFLFVNLPAISTPEADAAAVVREAVDIYRKNMDYQDKESVQRYRDALQLFGEACYLSLLLREREDV